MNSVGIHLVHLLGYANHKSEFLSVCICVCRRAAKCHQRPDKHITPVSRVTRFFLNASGYRYLCSMSVKHCFGNSTRNKFLVSLHPLIRHNRQTEKQRTHEEISCYRCESEIRRETIFGTPIYLFCCLCVCKHWNLRCKNRTEIEEKIYIKT